MSPIALLLLLLPLPLYYHTIITKTPTVTITTITDTHIVAVKGSEEYYSDQEYSDDSEDEREKQRREQGINEIKYRLTINTEMNCVLMSQASYSYYNNICSKYESAHSRTIPHWLQ